MSIDITNRTLILLQISLNGQCKRALVTVYRTIPVNNLCFFDTCTVFMYSIGGYGKESVFIGVKAKP